MKAWIKVAYVSSEIGEQTVIAIEFLTSKQTMNFYPASLQQTDPIRVWQIFSRFCVFEPEINRAKR